MLVGGWKTAPDGDPGLCRAIRKPEIRLASQNLQRRASLKAGLGGGSRREAPGEGEALPRGVDFEPELHVDFLDQVSILFNG
jgi:hypothetical protein